MKPKEHLEKLIPLYLYGDLNEGEKKEFEVHIKYCERCRNELESMRSLHTILDKKITLQPTDELLVQSRLKLRDRLREAPRASLIESWWEKLSDFLIRRSAAFQLTGAAAMLLLGIVVGRFLVSSKGQSPFIGKEFSTGKIPAQDISQPFITNVDLIQYDPKSGEVTVRYKSINEVSMQGKIDDEPIRKVLVHTIRREDNPGQRLMAVKAFGGKTFTDDEIEEALIYAMQHDVIQGVRLRAAQVLKELPISQKLKNAFIRVLLKDSNPAIRIEAVDALSKVKEQEDVVHIFQDTAKDDDNEFIRLKTSKVLERRENPNLNQNDVLR